MSATLIGVEQNDIHATASLITGEQNRKLLRDAGVFTVSIFGGPGSGKTTLVDAALERLPPEMRVGVVVCDVFSHRDADRIALRNKQVVQVNTGDGAIVNPAHIRSALLRLDLKQLDLVFIENVGSLTGITSLDLGQEASVALLSVAGGDDKADKHPDFVRAVDVVLLNKTDLLPGLPFDLAAFRDDVQRLNPTAPLFELSTLRGAGVGPWIGWLKNSIGIFQKGRQAASRNGDAVSHWFG